MKKVIKPSGFEIVYYNREKKKKNKIFETKKNKIFETKR
jgi:hypothetical protein